MNEKGRPFYRKMMVRYIINQRRIVMNDTKEQRQSKITEGILRYITEDQRFFRAYFNFMSSSELEKHLRNEFEPYFTYMNIKDIDIQAVSYTENDRAAVYLFEKGRLFADISWPVDSPMDAENIL